MLLCLGYARRRRWWRRRRLRYRGTAARRRCSGLGKFLRQLRVLAMRNRFKEKLNFKLHLELATPLGHSVVGAYGLLAAKVWQKICDVCYSMQAAAVLLYGLRIFIAAAA